MKKVLFSLVTLMIFSVSFLGQNHRDITVKRGWNFAPFPALGYNSDMGLQYGVIGDIYYFGDGSKFPEYEHKFNVEASRYTQGSSVLHLFYDSKYLLKGVRSSFDISYLSDKMMDFYGYNGYQSPYSVDSSAAYYKFERKVFRVLADFSGKLSNRIEWTLGVGLYGFKTGEVTLDKYVGENSLYKEYVANGIISEEDSEGGSRIEIKAGLVHDTRDNEADPQRGFYSEAILTGSPDLGLGGTSYLKFTLVNRGYFSPFDKKVTFAYKIGLQNKVFGDIPFYLMPNISTTYMKQTTSEGLGGYTTIRGVLRNRIVGEGIFWTNFEARVRLFDFRFFGQDWYFSLNPFFDAGIITDKVSIDTSLVSIISSDKESLHMSVGSGIKAVMNRNFVISVEAGKALDSRDGDMGLNVGLNYIF